MRGPIGKRPNNRTTRYPTEGSSCGALYKAPLYEGHLVMAFLQGAPVRWSPCMFLTLQGDPPEGASCKASHRSTLVDQHGRLAADGLGPADAADAFAGLGLDVHGV